MVIRAVSVEVFRTTNSRWIVDGCADLAIETGNACVVRRRKTSCRACCSSFAKLAVVTAVTTSMFVVRTDRAMGRCHSCSRSLVAFDLDHIAVFSGFAFFERRGVSSCARAHPSDRAIQANSLALVGLVFTVSALSRTGGGKGCGRVCCTGLVAF